MMKSFVRLLARLQLVNSMWNQLPVITQLESTNDYCKLHANTLPNLSIVRAQFQTKGRGQFDRMWISNPGENLLFSILVKDVPVVNQELIREWIITGLMKWLKSHKLVPSFKIPNDIFVKGKKILGILVETRTWEDIYQWVVVGIGININQTVFPLETATSLAKECNTSFDLDIEMEKIKSFFSANFPWSRSL